MSPRLIALLCAAVTTIAGICAGAAGAATPGSLDTGFGHAAIANLGSDISLLGTAFQADGKLVLVGRRGVSSGSTLVVGRLTAAGALDGSFHGGLVNGPAIDSPFGTGSVGRAVAIQRDGKIVVVGKATDSSATGRYGLLVERFNSDGGLDTSFGSGGTVRALTGGLSGDGFAVAIQSDGKILATGSAATPTGSTEVAVVRLSAGGTLDSGFGAGGQALLNLGADSVAIAAAVQSDGKIVLAGSQSPGLQAVNALIARLTPAGALDTSFAGTGALAHQYARTSANSTFNALAIAPGGAIVAAGAATDGNQGADALLARFTPSGAQDGSFGSGGVVYTTSATNVAINGAVPGANAVAIASNGDIIAGGSIANSVLGDFSLWAFKPSGALDGAFGSGGVARTSFGATTSSTANALAIAPDGRIAAAGASTSVTTSAVSGVVVGYNGFAGSVPPVKPPPVKPPPPRFQVALPGLKGSDKIGEVVRHGLRVQVRCNQSCSLRVTLGITAGTARQEHILTFFRRCRKVHGRRRCFRAHAYRAVTIASGSARLRGAGARMFTLRLRRDVGRALPRHGRRLTVKLQVLAVSTVTHKRITISRGIAFRR
ncbi:MAG: hypothetical protein ACR2IP_10335 [Solirubrobacteraceae bacterium]